jgi:predicted negative regulator of RcsB-dependent stress response
VSLADFLSSLEDSGDPERALLERTLVDAEKRSADLAYVIRACAIPYRFDEEVIGALRYAGYDTAGNALLLTQLLDYSFVLRREDGGFRYHDRVRDLLLADWRSDEHRDEFEELTWRIVEQLVSIHLQAVQAEDDAARVGRIVQRASPERFAQIGRLLETRLLDPLLQAIQQLALLSAQATLEFVEEYVGQFVNAGRTAAARVLTRAARDAIRSAPDQERLASVSNWLTYWDAFVLVRSRRGTEAEALLEGLLELELDDERLRLWVLSELGQSYSAQLRFSEARETFRREVALGESSGVDPANLPIAYLRLGSALMVDRPAEAVEPLTRAIELAEADDEAAHALVAALTSLRECYSLLGRLDEARAVALKALDAVRADPQGERMRSEWVTESMMWSVALDDPELLDTVSYELEALVSGMSDPTSIAGYRLDRVNAISTSGQLDRARAMLEKVSDEVRAGEDERLRIQLLRVEGGLHEDFGELEAAVAAYDACAAEAEGAFDDVRADALLSAGWLRVRMGRLDRAEIDLLAAEALREQQGLDGLAAAARIDRSRIARKRADIGAARELLDLAARDLVSGTLDLKSDLKLAEGELERRCGRTDLALVRAREATELAMETGSPTLIGTALTALAVAARESGGWAEAWDASSQMVEVFGELKEAAAYRRPAARKQADEANGQGVRALSGEGPNSMAAARDLFRSALALVPSAPWYRLNLAYAYAGLEDWGLAAEELSTALESDARLRCPALEARLAGFDVERGTELAMTGEPDRAGEAFESALGRLHGPDDHPDRRRALMGLGDSLRARGDLAGAADSYRRARDAGEPQAWLALFEVLTAGGDRDGAHELAWHELRENALDGGVEAALRLLVEAGDEEPDNDVLEALRESAGAGAVESLGEQLENAGRPTLARAAYELVQSDVAAAALRLGDLLRTQGDYEAALSAYREAIGSEDSVVAPEAAYRLGELHASHSDFDAAAGAYQQALAHPNSDVAAWAGLRLGEVRRLGGDLEGAAAALEEAVAREDNPSASLALVALGDVYVETGAAQEAEAAYRAAIRHANPDATPRAASALIDLVAREGDDSKSSAIVDEVLAQGALAALGLGDLRWQRGDLDGAERILARASDLDGDLWAPDAALRLGELRADRGDAEGALEALQRAIDSLDAPVAARATLRAAEIRGTPLSKTVAELADRSGQALLYLSNALWERNDPAGAESTLRVAMTQGDQMYRSQAALTLGDLLAVRGDRDAAATAYQTAIDSGDDYAASYAQERLRALEHIPR